MKVTERRELPPVPQTSRPWSVGPASLWHVIHHTDGEEMPGVKVAVPVVEVLVEGVIQGHTAVFADLVQSVRPSVTERTRQVVPGIGPQLGLQRVVVGSSRTTQLDDRIELRKRTILVDVAKDGQFASFAADVTYLGDDFIAEGLLHLQAVVQEVRRTEVLVDRENAQTLRIGRTQAERIGTGLDSWEDEAVPAGIGYRLIPLVT